MAELVETLAPVVEHLLETDAMTPNSDGTPAHYIVEADNVEYLVRKVIEGLVVSGVVRLVDKSNPDHEPDGAEYVPVCPKCWEPVELTEADDGTFRHV